MSSPPGCMSQKRVPIYGARLPHERRCGAIQPRSRRNCRLTLAPLPFVDGPGNTSSSEGPAIRRSLRRLKL